MVKKFYNSDPLKCFKTSSQVVFLFSSNFPKLGINLLPKIYKAVDLPIPFVPTNPKTYPLLGVGSLCNLNEFLPYLIYITLPMSCFFLHIFRKIYNF